MGCANCGCFDGGRAGRGQRPVLAQTAVAGPGEGRVRWSRGRALVRCGLRVLRFVRGIEVISYKFSRTSSYTVLKGSCIITYLRNRQSGIDRW
eukprot:6845185-Prymnesium_polylepis.1